jgi:phosphoribosylaminoimidazolecarboxamide formyltransferase/IMP cyclohydrolase
MSDLPIRRALISVSDKSDLLPFARALAARGVEIISTGGTARALADAGLTVTPVEKLTGFPEIMDGRVKTLHPLVHGALLGVRDNPAHETAMREHGIKPIDLVCINLYPFESTVANPAAAMAEAIESIDVGGPAMIRAAAKNHRFVAVVTSPKRYDRIISELDSHEGCITEPLRAELAAEAFARTAEYDAAIAAFLSRRSPEAFPEVLRLTYTKVEELRYGENPHQLAALYRDPASTGPSVVNARQLHGKQLSYNNILDAAAALEVGKALRRLVEAGEASLFEACIVKHTNPCGAALAPTVRGAVEAAIAGDPVAAYGGILAVGGELDLEAARAVVREGNFFEVVVAPDFDGAELALLRERWANVRLLAAGDRKPSSARKLDYRSVPGGMLVQDRDLHPVSPGLWQHRAGPRPSPEQIEAAAFLETVCRYVTSNAIVIGGRDSKLGCTRLFGIGSGQVDRVSACRLAASKAGENARGAVAAGDAFFPFDDGPRVLIDAGVSMILHPGGSKRDDDTFRLCEQHAVTCMTTGSRHFRH